MEFRHLRCFVAIAEELHFARAAEKLHIEQSPLSRTIIGLEADLDVLLFERTTRSTRLTHAGRVFLEQPLIVAVPTRHPLLAYKRLPLDEVLRYPLVMCDPDACEGCSQQVAKVLRTVDMEPIVAEQVTTHDLMMTLVAAGYGLGFTTEAQISGGRNVDVVARPLVGRSPILTTYLLRPDIEPSEQLNRFIGRVSLVDAQADSPII